MEVQSAWRYFVTYPIKFFEQKSVQDILNAQHDSQQKLQVLYPLLMFYPWTPKSDDTDIPMQPLVAFQRGQFNKIPVMLGTVKEEVNMAIIL
jgi:carboxylesterase type B